MPEITIQNQRSSRRLPVAEQDRGALGGYIALGGDKSSPLSRAILTEAQWKRMRLHFPVVARWYADGIITVIGEKRVSGGS